MGVNRTVVEYGVPALMLLGLCAANPTRAMAEQETRAAAPPAAVNGPIGGRERPRSASAQPPVTRQQERRIRAFVQEHHPQLASVLAHLEANRPNEYQRALQDLNKHRERVLQWRTRDPERYALELKQWKLQSRAQLLAARLSMANQQELEDELRELVREQVATRLEILRREHQRIVQREARLEEQIQQMEENRERFVEGQLKALTRNRQKLNAEPEPQPTGDAAAAAPGSPEKESD